MACPPWRSALATAPDDIRAHLARTNEFHARGTVLLAGAFHDPEGSLSTMGIFTTRQAAEEYATGDPFVINGMVHTWNIREWNDVLASSETPRRTGRPATRL